MPHNGSEKFKYLLESHVLVSDTITIKSRPLWICLEMLNWQTNKNGMG